MKDILIRALKTFVQGFLGALAVTLPTAQGTNLKDEAALVSLLIGAIAAGISAVMNMVITLLDSGGEKK